MLQNRWRSKVLWTGITAAIIQLVGNLGLYATIGLTEAKLVAIVNTILFILEATAVINDPTNKTNF